MIDTKELRLGNLIYWDIPSKKDIVHEIVGVTWRRINTIPISLGDNIEEYKPIQLTDEWLEHYGAQRNYDNYIYDRFIFIWKKSYKYWYVVDLQSNVYLTKIEFVHEWQNFNFAMSGEELNKFEKL